ncbi:hypothetical protein CR194_14725 [Salipaludibacillus keqinensis]|uniref:Uncharacterized protein n=1 Tax=Salipaludibacillus keqinensis TaxID=2045207 RepID=A0A323TG93_9BACI|nr:hypothetical protein [Salipaludibacillus keqinensis]PYZ92894.1 hypothetical protein CR194_14725 [Salipaludibacillus keqinensis]
MRTLLISTIDQMNQSKHMEKLLKKHQLHLCVISEDESWNISFERDLVYLTSLHIDQPDVVIEGDEDILKQLFLGEDFLLAMNRRRDLGVKGSLRKLLWVESLLYLANK